MTANITPDDIRELARACGFELAGVAAAVPTEDRARYREWVAAGWAGHMGYLAGHRALLRDDPRHLLPSARSVICVGKLYQTPWPHTTRFRDPDRAWISRYAWGEDYHRLMRRGLERLDALLRERLDAPLRERARPPLPERLDAPLPEPLDAPLPEPLDAPLHERARPPLPERLEPPPGERAVPAFESRICVDTAPLLERSYAHLAGLGWIGKNTCLIHQGQGSWFFLGELLVSLEIAPGMPPPDRCGTCTRCIDACPTAAIVPGKGLDATLCISYFTIELHGAIPEPQRAQMGAHVFGCDICQDVCPWNRRAPVSAEPAFAPRHFAPPLSELAAISKAEFRGMFRGSPVTRARYRGFLRNVAVAMGNARSQHFRAPLERLAAADDPIVAEHARWALSQLPPP